MRVLVAPQEFKESLTADQAAAAMARGIRRVRPDIDVDVLPLSDGGPGFIDALATALSGQRIPVPCHDCLGRPRSAEILLVDNGHTAIVEAALANGLALVRPDARRPLEASTEGVGELIAAAASRRPARIIVGVGGSATTDGGSGVARELGARLLDDAGRDVPPGGAALGHLARIVWSAPRWTVDTTIIVATDVTNPLTGPNGAAHVYSPQKGATEQDVAVLDAALGNWARVIERDLGVAVAALPGAGAAGGLAAGLVAFLGAAIESGFDVVAHATRLEERLETADLVITGEGHFDAQSLTGKTTGRLRALAGQHGVRCVIIAGRADGDVPDVISLAEREPDTARSMAHAAQLVEQAAAGLATSL